MKRCFNFARGTRNNFELKKANYYVQSLPKKVKPIDIFSLEQLNIWVISNLKRETC